MLRVPLRQRLGPISSSPFASGRYFSCTRFRKSPIPTRPRASANGTSANDAAYMPESFSAKVGNPGVRKQVLFFVTGSFVAFTLAAINTTEETEFWVKRLIQLSPVWGVQPINSTDLKRTKNAELIKNIKERYAALQARIKDFPALIKPWISLAYVTAMQPYADMTEGKRLCWKICLFNAAIYGFWKLRRLQPFMMRSFMHHPLSGLSYSMLTSTFSHQSFFHLLLNCLALESFGSAAYYYLTREQAKTPVLEASANSHFLAFFVSAGIFSGLVSHIASAKFVYPKYVAQLVSPANLPRKAESWASAVSATATSSKEKVVNQAAASILPSLGASGAIYSCVIITALGFPDAQVSLFIPPTYPIPIQWGVGGLVALDITGILRGWKMFDHWAHLGGAAFGLAYYNYGPAFWYWMRRTFEPQRPERPTVSST